MSHVTSSLLGTSSSLSPIAPSAATGEWESLRKRSRLLETQVQKKLQELAAIQTKIMNEGRHQTRSNAKLARVDSELDGLRATSSSAATSSSSSSSSSDSLSSSLLQYDTVSRDLSELLRTFSDTSDALSRLLSDHSTLSTDANNYIVTKSRTAVSDATLEFRRTKQNIQAALARAELMAGSASRREQDQLLRPRTEILLREESGLQHSIKKTDDAIAQAVSARDSLSRQSAIFTNVRQKLNSLNTTFPVIGHLMNRINCKHQRDMIVLSCVIAVCMIITFLYIMSKP